jgi:hypothetical protein
MKIALLALAGTAVALTAMPADAQRHSNQASCAQMRHGRCVAWNRTTRAPMGRAAYRVGYRFGPSYSYTDYSALPQPYVTRYRLSPNYRYVYSGNRIYVVDPTTYAVRRVINAITR